MRLGDQILDDVEVPMPRPWMEMNHNGWLLCLMCPQDKTTHQGRVQYFRGVNTRRKNRDQVRRWVYHHLGCGFKGLK